MSEKELVTYGTRTYAGTPIDKLWDAMRAMGVVKSFVTIGLVSDYQQEFNNTWTEILTRQQIEEMIHMHVHRILREQNLIHDNASPLRLAMI